MFIQHGFPLLAASFVVANGTARHISSLSAPEVTFVITGKSYNGRDQALACAEYLEELLKGNQPDEKPFFGRVMESRDAFPHLDPAQRDYPFSDLEYCSRIDRFDFAMPVTREGGKLILRTVKPTRYLTPHP